MKKSICMIATILTVIGIGSAALALNRTDYRPLEECSLCRKAENSILTLYSKVNGVGILNFNDFTISTLRICNKKPNLSMSGSSHITNASGEDGSIISIDSNIDRRIADVTISTRDGSIPHPKENGTISMRRLL